MAMPEDDKPVTRGELREELAATGEDLRGELAATKNELRTEIAATKNELRTEIAATRTELRTEIAATKADISRLDSKTDKMWVEVVKGWARVDQKQDQMLSALVRFRDEMMRAFEESVSKGRMFSEKALTHGDMLSNHELRLADHERRLRTIESPPQL